MSKTALHMDTAVTALHGVGPAMEKRLAVLGVHTVGDLLLYLPSRHDDRRERTDIVDVLPDEKVTLVGTIEKIASRRAYRRRMVIVEAMVGDDTGSIKVVWFNQPYIADTLHVGDHVAITGTAKKNKYGLAFQSPSYEKLSGDSNGNAVHSGRIVPEYGLTSGITQKQLRHFVKQILDAGISIPDFLPDDLIQQLDLLPLDTAVREMHFPEDDSVIAAARRRIDFNSILFPQLYALRERAANTEMDSVPLPFQEDAIREFVAGLPFTLTDAQRRAAWDALRDMERGFPMQRLLVGDVGSGKTVVAAIAMYQAVLSGQQAVLMAPTEILAKQHATTLRSLFEAYDVSVALLTGSTKEAGSATRGGSAVGNAHQTQLDGTQPDIIVGTHALIQDGVEFEKLALVVVDEQHRFGVRQRKTLRENSGNPDTMPHLLSMTATPIPRTLALSLYGDLDLSVIDELPAGRLPVKTHVVPNRKRKGSYEFIREHVAEGEQVFVICPLVDPSDKLGARSVTEEYERLHTKVFPDLRIGMVHGKLKPDEKDAVMQQMKAKELDLLVSTSVIEVGVDIPDATIMLIEGAERFGLAQLHQFRGRVGRNDKQSYCFLFTEARSERALERLHALETSNDGFALAKLDLEMRGAGEVFGTNQSGFSESTVIALQQPELLESARSAAELIIKKGWLDTYPSLAQRLEHFSDTIHLE